MKIESDYRRITEVINYDCSHESLHTILISVDEHIKKYPENTYKNYHFSAEDDYGSTIIQLNVSRKETDEERNVRLISKAEREKYEELKKKFEGKS